MSDPNSKFPKVSSCHKAELGVAHDPSPLGETSYYFCTKEDCLQPCGAIADEGLDKPKDHIVDVSKMVEKANSEIPKIARKTTYSRICLDCKSVVQAVEGFREIHYYNHHLNPSEKPNTSDAKEVVIKEIIATSPVIRALATDNLVYYWSTTDAKWKIFDDNYFTLNPPQNDSK